jgi:hypothetical protein
LVRPAFAMTISISQGQTIKVVVGLNLVEPCFSHGLFKNLLVLAHSRSTTKVVYHGALA